MVTTPRAHQPSDRYSRNRSLSPQDPIRRYSSSEAIQIKNEIKAQLQPAIKQWLATQSNLTSAERQQIGRAIRTAYKRGKTALPIPGVVLPNTIKSLLAQRAERPRVLEQLPALNTVLFNNGPSPASRQSSESLSHNSLAYSRAVAGKDQPFNESLAAWVQGGIGERAREKRAEAARRIQTAYDQQLDRLELAGWELSELPESLTQLHSLKELNISDNCLQQLPDWFNQLENLKTVHIKGNYFIKLPEVLQAMPVTLDIATPGESMTELAERMEFEGIIKVWKEQEGSAGVARKSGAANILLTAYLQKSTALDLSNHQLPNLPEGIFSKLGQLRSVVLFNNQLQALPDDFSQLKLKHLVLACNQFSNFPTPLHSMATLEHLNLSHNALTQISAESVVDLQELKYLNLGNNKLSQLFFSDSSTTLSRELLPKLESLNFNHNKLTQLPELKRLAHLKALGGAGNYLDPVPDILRKLRNPWFQQSWDNPQAPWVQRQLPEKGPALNRLTESLSGAGVHGMVSGRTEPAFTLREMQPLPTRTHPRG